MSSGDSYAAAPPDGAGAYALYTIRDAAGYAAEVYGWWPLSTAEQILARRRSHHSEDGPFTLVRRTWTAVDEDVAIEAQS